MKLTLERTRRGWSRAELARHARMRPTIVGLIEGGRFRPYPHQLGRLARALRIPWGEEGSLLEPEPTARTQSPRCQPAEADHGRTSQ